MSPRRAFILNATLERVAAHSWDAMQLASSHDPDHAKELKRLKRLIYAEFKLQDNRFAEISSRLEILERQMERIGAPLYRRVRKGVYAERVRGKKAGSRKLVTD